MKRHSGVRVGGSGPLLVYLMLGWAAAVTASGCKKDSAPPPGKDPTTVVLTGSDVGRDGSIAASGLKKLEDRAKEPKLSVVFLRVTIGDAALNQLAKFPNVRRVEAIGSRITTVGVANLKRAIPEVEIVQ